MVNLDSFVESAQVLRLVLKEIAATDKGGNWTTAESFSNSMSLNIWLQIVSGFSNVLWASADGPVTNSAAWIDLSGMPAVII
jgi:hypothetical protein